MAQVNESKYIKMRSRKLAITCIKLILIFISTLHAQSIDKYYEHKLELDDTIEKISSNKMDFAIQLGSYEKYSQSMTVHRIEKTNKNYTYFSISIKKLSSGSEISVVTKPIDKDVVEKSKNLPTIADVQTAIASLQGSKVGLGAPVVYYVYDQKLKKWLSLVLPDVSEFYETRESKAIFEFFEFMEKSVNKDP